VEKLKKAKEILRYMKSEGFGSIARDVNQLESKLDYMKDEVGEFEDELSELQEMILDEKED
jgi:hypothetical protein